MATKKTAKVKKMDGFSADVRQEKLDALKQLVPEAFADGKIDVKRLRKLVGEEVATEDERYRLEWSGKAEVFDEIAERSSCTLTLDKKRSSKDWKDSNNIFIEGENLEVLRTLQKAYSGKVKMIYIDPPYNTGKDFVYNDNFRETEEEYCEDECNIDENGLLKKAYKLNSRDGGRFHSNWLSMMYPRLYLARNLLRDDGVIFVSIDDNEVQNLRLIMDEIFGADNLLSIHHIQVRYGNKSLNEKKDFQELCEYVLIYSKSKQNNLGLNKPSEAYPIEKFNLQIEHESKPSKTITVGNKKVDVWLPGKFSIKKQKAGSVDFFKETWISGSILSGTGHGKLYTKVIDSRRKEDGSGCLYRVYGVGDDGLGYRYYTNPSKDEADRGKMYTKVPSNKLEEITNGDSRKESPIINYYDFSGDFGNIRHEGGIAFNAGKKPVKMLRQFINYFKEKDYIALDFFAGSASFAHAVMEQNADDGGSRKHISIQIPEVISADDDAYKSGYRKISDLAITRINNSIKEVKKTYPDYKGDLGIRVYEETESHFPQWHSQVFESDKDLEQAMIDYSKAEPEGTAFDRATEVLLKLGYPLTTEITEKDGYMLAADEVALVLDTKFQVKNLQKVLDAAPKTVVILEKLFKKDQDKINFALRCKEAKVIFQTV